MNSTPKIDAAYKLTNNLSRLLVDLAKDFEHRTLAKCHDRGHTKIRQSHTSLFSNLGFEAVRLTELAERAGITQQAMGKLVKEMEHVGYVKRHTDETDKRAKIIELTAIGETLVNDSVEIVDEVTAEYETALSSDGILDLERVLRKSVSGLGLRYLPDTLDRNKISAA
jgi:DNA-binding MarR family transcriptional regulator